MEPFIPFRLIVNVHHAYINKKAAMLKEMSFNVAEHHGKTNPELNVIRDRVDELITELSVHMKKEERILFPYIKQLASSDGKRPGGFSSVMQAISVMEHDHDIAGALIEEIRQISNDYTTPVNACNSFKFLHHKLKEFQDDLNMHIHLENNILSPGAVALEASLN